MESLQLFTGLLLAVCTIHLVFSTVEGIDQWLEKTRGKTHVVAKGTKLVRRSSWYVFFDPADLYGRQQPTGKNKPLRNNTVSREQRPRPRSAARL